MELDAGLFLQVADDAEEVAGLRIAARAEHVDEASMRGSAARAEHVDEVKLHLKFPTSRTREQTFSLQQLI